MKQRITAAELKAMTMNELAAWVEFNACAINRTMVMSWGHEELFKGYHIRPEYIGWKAGRLIVKTFHFTSRTRKADAQSFAEWLHWAIFGEYPAEETTETAEQVEETETEDTTTETIEETAEEAKEVATMKKYFKVTFEYAADIYCTNLAHAETAEDVEREYSKYPWKVIKEAQPWDVEEARMKGMPVIEVETVPEDPETEEQTEEAAEEAAPEDSENDIKGGLTMEYTINHNEAFNSLEISFDGKPSEAVRDALKALKFRWHKVKGLWYGYASEDAVKAAIEGVNTGSTNDKPDGVKAVQKPAKAATQEHIRIYWNGIKIDGGKLVKCGYSLDNDISVNGPCVTVYARGYSDLPRDLLPVRNDSDSFTDYFEEDRATLLPDHPLYRYFRYAAMKAKARDDVKYCERLRETLNSGCREPWPGHFDTIRADLERREKFLADFAGEKDPGQPTAADLEAIDKRRQEAENARLAAEHEAELKERERLLIMKNDGRRLIEDAAAAHPVEEGAPAVVINWSEHPAFYHWEDDKLVLSVAAADRILAALDAKQHADRETPDGRGWYYKTKFTITGRDEGGEAINYQGRYDIGDGEGGLIQHIRNFGEWYRTHDEFGHELPDPEETNSTIEFANYLNTFTA